jgi:transposase
MMTQWAKPAWDRCQLVLFPQRLDEAVAREHPVRLLDDILSRLDWTAWEAKYHVNLGQPAIHPRVLAGVILYGLLTRIRSSRALEEALHVRLDFRWLAEGRALDHSTLSEFRRKHPPELKDLFINIGLLAREMGWLSLELLAYDGPRIRANNKRSKTRTPEELKQMREELAAKYAELDAKIKAQDTQDEEVLLSPSPEELAEELADVARRRVQVDQALEELRRVEEAGQTQPSRIPLTDPSSRVTPHKTGGFAPNYTPLATVDVQSGLIVQADVIAMTDEDKHLVRALHDVKESFGLDHLPPEVLSDGMMATGENLEELAQNNVTLYAPIPVVDQTQNPALRADPRQAVAAADWERLPTKTVKNRQTKKKQQQLDKSAFVYDEAQDCYWCPMGQALPHVHTTSETKSSGHRIYVKRYQADAELCAACPLKAMCLSGQSAKRQINRDQHETRRNEQAKRMATKDAQEKYELRRHAAEFPFAVIKPHFGVRQFLLRGLAKVQTEWLWLASAFNLTRLFGLMKSGVDPPRS